MSTLSMPQVETPKLMLSPDFYPDRPADVKLIETHISWVFLTDRYAYKLKKPVSYEFLDFTTLEARRQACEDEVRLNRRLAPDVYLKVLPVTEDARGRRRLGRDGQVIDWVVKMRRLPANRTLEELLQRDQLSERDIQRLARRLADFYTRAAPLTIRPERYREEIEHHVRANFSELSDPRHGLAPAAVTRVHSAQLQFLNIMPDLLDRRVCDGRIVEGHGDLRPEHIYLEHEPAIIDCVEFSYELRTLDVVDELCFLAMECDRLRASRIGQQVMETYSATSGDRPPQRLQEFYKCYRASVRAKVAALRSDQLAAPQRDAIEQSEQEYLQWADQYARHLGKPLLVIVRGLMGTGKSTLAEALSDALGLRIVQTDKVRQQLFPHEPAADNYGEGKYQSEQRQRVYDSVFGQSSEWLDEGISVVLDGAFLTTETRAEAVRQASRTGAELLVVECRCPAEVAAQRIADRLQTGSGPSEARPEFVRTQQRDEQPNPPGLSSLIVETADGLGGQLESVFAGLRLLIGEPD